MRRPLLLFIIIAISYSQTELSSPNKLNSVIYPLLFCAALLILIIWSTRRFGGNRRGDGGLNDSNDGFLGGGKNSDADSGDGGGD